MLDILRADGVGNEGVAKISEEDEADGSGVEFFVRSERGEDGFGGDVGGEVLGKVVPNERGEDLVGGGLGEAGFFD